MKSKFLKLVFAFVAGSSLLTGANVEAKAKKVAKVVYEDGSTEAVSPNTVQTKVVYQKSHNPDRFIRRITPAVGLIIGDTTIKTSGMRVGLLTGVLTDLIGKNELVFETGVLYRQMGTSNNGATTALNYITIPLSAKYYFSGQSSSGFYTKAGFTPGFNVAASITQNNATRDVGKDINTFDFGFLMGFGGRYLFSDSASAIFEVGYNRGLASVVNTPSDANGVPSVNTLAYSVMSGVSIEL